MHRKKDNHNKTYFNDFFLETQDSKKYTVSL